VTERSPFERVLAVLVGVTALVASLIAVLQVDWGRKSERSSLLSARLPVQIFEGIAASGNRTTFHLRSTQDAVAFGLEALARQLAAFKFPDVREAERAIGVADLRASERLRAITGEMASIDLESRGVDSRSVRALTASVAQLQETTRVQNREADRSDVYGDRQDRTVFALSLVAIAGALLALAAVLRKGAGGRISMGAGTLALVASAAWAIWSFF
jgi:hypothetical protein